MSRVVAVALLAVPVGGCASNKSPVSSSSAPTTATAPPRASPHTFTAQIFLRGMKVTAPDAHWVVYEDHPGEFNLAAPPGALNNVHVHFWLDPFATAVHGRRQRAIGRTPMALIEWLRHDRDFVVSQPVRRPIAGGLTATSVDLDLSATAPREDPSCSGPCRSYLGFSGGSYAFDFGSGRHMPVRLYFAPVRRGGRTRVLTVVLESPSLKAFNAASDPVDAMVASLRLPARLDTGHGPGVGTADR